MTDDINNRIASKEVIAALHNCIINYTIHFVSKKIDEMDQTTLKRNMNHYGQSKYIEKIVKNNINYEFNEKEMKREFGDGFHPHDGSIA